MLTLRVGSEVSTWEMVDTMSRDQAAAPSRRRTHSVERRRQVVAETYAPGASVSVVARRHDLNTNLVFKWRQRYSEKAEERAVLLPVQLSEAVPESPRKTPSRLRAATRTAGWIEIDLAGGHRVRIHGAADARTVRHVLRNLAR